MGHRLSFGSRGPLRASPNGHSLQLGRAPGSCLDGHVILRNWWGKGRPRECSSPGAAQGGKDEKNYRPTPIDADASADFNAGLVAVWIVTLHHAGNTLHTD